MARYGRERESLSLVLAIVLHGIALFVVHRWGGAPSALPPVAKPGVGAERVVEIDLSDAPLGSEVAQAAPAEAPSSGGAVVSPSGYSPKSSVGKRAASVTAPPEDAAPAPEVVASAEPTPEPDGAATGAGRQGPIDLGIGPEGWQRWVGVLPTEPRAPTQSPRGRPLVQAPPASSTGGLQEGLEAHDRKVGVGPAGRVATALFQAAHASDAPETGTALFNVTVLRTGAVEVRLGETADKRWQAVAEHAAEALRKAPPRIPPPREGYRLTLRITAEETMPNGLRRKDLHGARLEATPLRFKSQAEAQREAELANPTAGVGPDNQEFRGSPITMDLPGIYVTGQGKTCSYRFGISPLGLLLQGGCDPVNAGAKLQRMVRTEVREQSAF